jgi:hypothetical protein
MIAVGATAAPLSYPAGGAYTFTGVAGATSGPCPYKAKAAVAGYTYFGAASYTLDGKPALFLTKGPNLIFSPGVGAQKVEYNLRNVSFTGGSTKATGNATLTYLPSTTTFAGTYALYLKSAAGSTFSATLSVVLSTPQGVCKTGYVLTFAKGLPPNLVNLL